MNYSDIAFARLNLEYDQKLFALEYDKFILPVAQHIANGMRTWKNTRELNKSWGMVDPDTYDKCNLGLGFTQVIKEIPQWQMAQLMYLVTQDDDPEIIKQASRSGGTFVRNMTLDREWKFKPEFEHLSIVKFIKTLPLSKIVSIHCVSLEPGSFASIHRDCKYFEESGKENTVPNNGVYQRGHVVITLNISDGGAPLFWALDGKDAQNVLTANDPAYIISDYFLHGVPVCTSRRRQVRITGIPTEELQNLIDDTTKVVLPPDYAFDEEKDWYPG